MLIQLFKKNTHAFTLIELIISIMIVAILATVAIVSYTNVLNESKYEADKTSSIILTNTTAAYAALNDTELSDVFDGLSTDAQRLDYLLSNEQIAKIPTPAQEGASFTWNQDSLKWEVSGGMDLSDDDSGGSDGGSSEPEYDAWISGTKYAKGDYVIHDGKTYFSRGNTKREPGTHQVWQEVSDSWVHLNYYSKGDLIEHNGKTYIANKNTLKKEPGTHKNWNEISDSWVHMNTYKKGDTIIYNGVAYIAKRNSHKRNPEISSKHWEVVE